MRLPKITSGWLKIHFPALASRRSFVHDYITEIGITEPITLLRKLATNGDYDLANVLIVRIMDRRTCLKYAIFAAEDALPRFEEQYPNNDIPRNAIGAAKKCLADDTRKNREDAYVVSSVIYNASKDHNTVDRWATSCEAQAAQAAADATHIRICVVRTAARIAVDCAADFKWGDDVNVVYRKILEHGIKLLMEN